MESQALSAMQNGCKLGNGVRKVSEKHLIEAIARRYMEMPRKKRVAIVREFAARSAADKRFFRTYFPELFTEAFPHPKPGARPASARARQRRATRKMPRGS
jgi:hypothetical protein